MQAYRPFGDRDHGTVLNLLSELVGDLADQIGNIGSAKAFSADADHRWPVGATDGKQSMEIRVEGDDRAALIERHRRDFRITRSALADVGDMADIKPLLQEVLNRAARQTLVQQQPDHAAPRWMT